MGPSCPRPAQRAPEARPGLGLHPSRPWRARPHPGAPAPTAAADHRRSLSQRPAACRRGVRGAGPSWPGRGGCHGPALGSVLTWAFPCECLSVRLGGTLHLRPPSLHELVLTNYVRQERISKGHVLRFQEDVDLGRTLLVRDGASGARVLDKAAEPMRPGPAPSPPPGPGQPGPGCFQAADHYSGWFPGTFQTLLLRS